MRFFPRDGTEEDAIIPTETNMKNMIQARDLGAYRDIDKALVMRVFNVTDSQDAEINKDVIVSPAVETFVSTDQDGTTSNIRVSA